MGSVEGYRKEPTDAQHRNNVLQNPWRARSERMRAFRVFRGLIYLSADLCMQRVTPNQLKYIRTLLEKRGVAEPPNLDKWSALNASKLIAGLQDRRLIPTFHPDGRWKNWEDAPRKKASTYSYDRR